MQILNKPDHNKNLTIALLTVIVVLGIFTWAVIDATNTCKPKIEYKYIKGPTQVITKKETITKEIPITTEINNYVPYEIEKEKIVVQETIIEKPVFVDNVAADLWNEVRLREILIESECYTLPRFNTTVPSRFAIKQIIMGAGLGDNKYSAFIKIDYHKSRSEILESKRIDVVVDMIKGEVIKCTVK